MSIKMTHSLFNNGCRSGCMLIARDKISARNENQKEKRQQQQKQQTNENKHFKKTMTT